jgi:hypothetical protein
MVRIFAIPSEGVLRTTGVVVQLVRIRACHARGRGFESRPFRIKSLTLSGVFFVYMSFYSCIQMEKFLGVS